MPGFLPRFSPLTGGKAMAVTNDQIIQAVFTATDEAKVRALAILEGGDPASAESRPPEPDDTPLLMGMGESAEFLGVSRATLWRMIRDGRLTKVEIYHNAFRLRRSDILALVNERTTRGADIPVCASAPSNHHLSTINSTSPEIPHG